MSSYSLVTPVAIGKLSNVSHLVSASRLFLPTSEAGGRVIPHIDSCTFHSSGNVFNYNEMKLSKDSASETQLEATQSRYLPRYSRLVTSDELNTRLLSTNHVHGCHCGRVPPNPQARYPLYMLELLLHRVYEVRRSHVERLQYRRGNRPGARFPALHLDDDHQAVDLHLRHRSRTGPSLVDQLRPHPLLVERTIAPPGDGEFSRCNAGPS